MDGKNKNESQNVFACCVELWVAANTNKRRLDSNTGNNNTPTRHIRALFCGGRYCTFAWKLLQVYETIERIITTAVVSETIHRGWSEAVYWKIEVPDKLKFNQVNVFFCCAWLDVRTAQKAIWINWMHVQHGPYKFHCYIGISVFVFRLYTNGTGCIAVYGLSFGSHHEGAKYMHFWAVTFFYLGVLFRIIRWHDIDQRRTSEGRYLAFLGADWW